MCSMDCITLMITGLHYQSFEDAVLDVWKVDLVGFSYDLLWDVPAVLPPACLAALTLGCFPCWTHVLCTYIEMCGRGDSYFWTMDTDWEWKTWKGLHSELVKGIADMNEGEWRDLQCVNESNKRAVFSGKSNSAVDGRRAGGCSCLICW